MEYSLIPEDQTITKSDIEGFVNLQQLYNQKKYEDCRIYLEKIIKNHPNDVAVKLNKYIIDFECSILSLVELRQHISQLIESTANNGHECNSTSSEDGSNDRCVLFYNMALVFYREFDFIRAEEYLNKISSEGHGCKPDFIKRYVYPLCCAVAIRLRNAAKAMDLLQKCIEVSLQSSILLKARAYIISRQFKLFKRDTKPSELKEGPNLVFYEFLKANIEFLKNNYTKSKRLLGLTIQSHYSPMINNDYDERSIELGSCFYNNLGCIHLMIHKPNLGAHYFKQAFIQSQQHKDEKRHLRYSWQRCRVLYNLGLAQLQAGHFHEAFTIFLETIPFLGTRPHLWLHIAECCIASCASGGMNLNTVAESGETVAPILKLYGVGNDAHKKIILNMKSRTKEKGRTVSNKSISLSLDLAIICLENASFFASSFDESLHTVINLNASFTHLCLNDHILALSFAQKVLKFNVLTVQNKILAKLYCGEALIYMDRISEAITFLAPLDPETIERISEQVSSDHKNFKMVLQYNLVVAFTLRGELEKAEEMIAHSLWPNSRNGSNPGLTVHVLMLRLYILLVKGDVEKCRKLLREHCQQIRN